MLAKRIIRRLFWAFLGGVLFLNLNLLLPSLIFAQTSRFRTLAEADRLYLAGDSVRAEQLYRQVKPPFANEGQMVLWEPMTDPTHLSAAGQVYWRNAQEGLNDSSGSQVFTSLDLLLQEQPEFLPAYLLYAEALQQGNQEEKAIEILEQGVSQFPESVELTKALIAAHEKEKHWLEASITARQFAIVYPDHPEAATFTEIADKDLGRFRRRLNENTLVQGILGTAVGIVSGDRGATGVQVASMLLQGESGMGAQLASQYSQQLEPVTDPEIVNYITEVGEGLAELMGRDFDYEFYVVKDDSFNASALPGGKVFVHTGLILNTSSEAELAGILGHEVAHAVLSHGFQKVTRAGLLANVGSFVPLGNIVSTLLTLDYSRQSERQADIVGNRALAAAGYAADGLRNSFFAMKQQSGSSPPVYLSSHPATDDRIRYLEDLIQRNGYNRYAFEGVERHAQMQNRLRKILSGEAVPPASTQTTLTAPAPQQSSVQSVPSQPASSQPTSGQSTPNASAPSSSPTRSARLTTGDIALSARQELSGVSIQFDGGYVNQTGSYEANVVIQNNSDRMFAFVPVFVKVQNTNGEEVQARFSFEDSDNTTADPGETLRGRLLILGQRWQNSSPQGLILVIREGTTGGRVFRVPIQ